MSRSIGLNAGRLDNYLEFELKTTTVNGDGQSSFTWGHGFWEWCEVQRQSEQSCRFIMHYRDISPRTWPDSYRILAFGAIWTITNAVPDTKNRMLIIDSDFSALVETTHLLSTTKEYIDGLPTVRPPE